MKALVVDDEPMARARLLRLLRDFPFFNQVIEADNGESAIALSEKHQSDVVFLDINMPGLDGLSVAKKLKQRSVPPAIIFTTAHAEHALAAFETIPQGYLLKPIEPDALAVTIEKLGQFTRAQLEAHKEETLLCHLAGNKIKISITDISYLSADDKYVKVVYREGEALTETSLKQLELNYAHQFIRIHRNTLINRDYICSSEYRDGTHFIYLRNCERPLEVSRRQWKVVKALL